MFDILFTSAAMGVALIVLRLSLVLLIVYLVSRFIGSVLENYMDNDDPISPARFMKKNMLNLIGFFVAATIFGFSFNTSAFVPKNTVEDTRSQEYVREKEEFASEHTEIKPSEADAKASSRKSDINIREEFAKHPDKK